MGHDMDKHLQLKTAAETALPFLENWEQTFRNFMVELRAQTAPRRSTRCADEDPAPPKPPPTPWPHEPDDDDEAPETPPTEPPPIPIQEPPPEEKPKGPFVV
jgi:hypothetical protein